MQERYIATADLGSSKIGLCVVRVDGNDVQIIYYKETPSDGIRHNCAFNPKRASEALKLAVKTAEDELKIKILQIVVGLPRYDIRQETGRAVLERTDPDRLIGRDEVEMIKNIALDDYPMENPREEIYGAVAQSFNADDMVGASEEDVVGTVCENLEGNFKIFVGARKYMSNIDIILGELGIAAAQKLFLPAVTAEAVLTADEMDSGVALIEMGGGVTSVSIFKGGILRHYSAIPFGGRSVTNDIRYECGFGESLAENIKLAFGACIPEKLQSMSEKILQINDDETGTYEHLPVKYLSDIITCRWTEIIEAICYQIQESGYADKLRNGVVITGGCAATPNMAALVKSISGYNVRTGYPRCQKFVTDGCPDIWETSASATVGMIMESCRDLCLNCLEKAPAGRSMVTASPVPEQEKEPEPDLEGTVFGGHDEPEPKPRPKPKPRPATGKSGKSVLWKKMKSSLETAFDNTVGSLYDDMNK